MPVGLHSRYYLQSAHPIDIFPCHQLKMGKSIPVIFQFFRAYSHFFIGSLQSIKGNMDSSIPDRMAIDLKPFFQAAPESIYQLIQRP